MGGRKERERTGWTRPRCHEACLFNSQDLAYFLHFLFSGLGAMPSSSAKFKYFPISLFPDFLWCHVYTSYVYIYIYNTLKKKTFILAVLGLWCCAWAFSSCNEQGLLSAFGVWASPCGGSSCCGVQALGMWAQQMGHLGLTALQCSGSPQPGIELVSPELAGGFLTIGPPGKPSINIYDSHWPIQLITRKWGN